MVKRRWRARGKGKRRGGTRVRKVEAEAEKETEKVQEQVEHDGDDIMKDEDFILADNPQNSSTDWMLIAAFISSIMGLFVLVYICIWAYKQCGRVEYEKIGTGMNGPSKLNRALGKVKRISLRNIGKNKNNDDCYDEESRNIMHPSASYTFDDD